MLANSVDEKLVKLSLWVTVAFAVASFVLGVLFSSQVIVFDGLYSLIGVGITSLSLFAMHFIDQEDWRRFPFGKEVIEPLVVVINYFVILLLVTASMINAVITIARGGQAVMLGPSLAYAALGTLICFIMYYYLAKKGRNLNSKFVAVEAHQWYMDGLVSAGILFGFILALVFQAVPVLQPAVPFVDPVMVLLVSVYFMRVPVLEIRSSLREILAMPPKESVRAHVEKAVRDLVQEYALEDYFLRVTKIGPKLLVELDFVVGENSLVQTIGQGDQVREELYRQLAGLGYEEWMTVSFTTQRKWL